MQLYSTNRHSPQVSLKEATFKGLPLDNGLYMPVVIPALPQAFFNNISKLSLQDIAFQVSKALFAGAVPDRELRQIVEDALNFDAPLVRLEDGLYALELFHGPSLAFKDFGARFMARLMAYFLEQSDEEVNILVATSGDTGSAVAQGFLDMPRIKITILYPSQKVSLMQEKQLTTLGRNITALEVNGTFDDCQRLVKQAFLDEELSKQLNLSSANSINISRMLPQSFYYFYAYAQLKDKQKPLYFSVPSGNFGNLCAGLLAARMGLPVAKFVASTNINDVVPQYLQHGAFQSRPSVSTISNSMDVGNPSNFARLLDLYQNDHSKITASIEGYSYTDEATKLAIKEVVDKYKYVLDPHAAVGYLGLKDAAQKTGKPVNGVVLATAHPAKFGNVVKEATGIDVPIPDRLHQIIDKEKHSVPMSADFEDFKQYLLQHK
jgi:threonine synthase